MKNNNENWFGKIMFGLGMFGLGYFIAKKYDSELSAWATKIKDEVEDEARKTRDLTKEKYDEIVDKVTEKYHRAKELDRDDLDRFAKRLKKRWEKIKRGMTEEIEEEELE